MLASDTVRGLLAAKIASLGYAVKEFRDDDDAITREELPCVLVQQAGTIEIIRHEYAMGGSLTHQASYFFSFAALTREAAGEMLVAAANAFAADTTIGGQIQDIMPVSYGDEDDDGKDFTSIMLENQVQFCTDPYDFGALIYL